MPHHCSISFDCIDIALQQCNCLSLILFSSISFFLVLSPGHSRPSTKLLATYCPLCQSIFSDCSSHWFTLDSDGCQCRLHEEPISQCVHILLLCRTNGYNNRFVPFTMSQKRMKAKRRVRYWNVEPNAMRLGSHPTKRWNRRKKNWAFSLFGRGDAARFNGRPNREPNCGLSPHHSSCQLHSIHPFAFNLDLGSHWQYCLMNATKLCSEYRIEDWCEGKHWSTLNVVSRPKGAFGFIFQ